MQEGYPEIVKEPHNASVIISLTVSPNFPRTCTKGNSPVNQGGLTDDDDNEEKHDSSNDEQAVFHVLMDILISLSLS